MADLHCETANLMHGFGPNMEVTLEALCSNCSGSAGRTQGLIPPQGFYKSRPLPSWDSTCCGGSCAEAVGVAGHTHQPYCVRVVR